MNDESTELTSNDFVARRETMIEKQLRSRNISSEDVIAAMASVPREEFVPPEYLESAYEDCALPIEHGQTISQPYTVAFMCEMACPCPVDSVLEIGTGSGYGAAVLSRIAQQVHTVERIPQLAESARNRLRRRCYENVTVHVDDGSRRVLADSPFDAIVVTACAPQLPQSLVEQLKHGGRIVIPVGDRNDQSLMMYRKKASGMETTNLGSFRFVPLIAD